MKKAKAKLISIIIQQSKTIAQKDKEIHDLKKNVENARVAIVEEIMSIMSKKDER